MGAVQQFSKLSNIPIIHKYYHQPHLKICIISWMRNQTVQKYNSHVKFAERSVCYKDLGDFSDNNLSTVFIIGSIIR